MHLHKITIFSENFPCKDQYPFNLDVFYTTKTIPFTSPVTFFIGDNGSGKSTLLQAIAKRCDVPIWKGFQRGRLQNNKYEERLYEYIRIEWCAGKIPGSFFAAEIFRDFAQVLDEWARTDPELLSYFGGESLLTKSHGQGHMAYFANRFKIKGIYFLDEPENALSPKKQLEFLQLLHTMSATGNAQFIIATHSPILLALPNSDIYSFDDSPIRKIAYEETDHYKIYKDFLNNRQKLFT